MDTKSKQERKREAEEKLRGLGAELLKAEDRFGETKTGWWLDGVWLAPKSDPVAAVDAVEGR